jgi:hypothetical protein
LTPANARVSKLVNRNKKYKKRGNITKTLKEKKQKKTQNKDKNIKTQKEQLTSS